MTLPPSDRTRATEQRYQEDKAAGRTKNLLDEPAIGGTEHWALKENAYPYDERWEVSHMLVYYRECEWPEIPEEDIMELFQLELGAMLAYDVIRKNGVKLQSVHTIPHVHFLKGPKS